MVVQPSQATPSATMAITIVIKLLLLLSHSPLTTPLSGLILSSQYGIFHSGSPGKKARLISEEGDICQSVNPSIIYTEFDKAATCLEELQFPVIYTRILELMLNICSSNNLIYNGTNKYTTKITIV